MSSNKAIWLLSLQRYCFFCSWPAIPAWTKYAKKWICLSVNRQNHSKASVINNWINKTKPPNPVQSLPRGLKCGWNQGWSNQKTANCALGSIWCALTLPLTSPSTVYPNTLLKHAKLCSVCSPSRVQPTSNSCIMTSISKVESVATANLANWWSF